MLSFKSIITVYLYSIWNAILSHMKFLGVDKAICHCVHEVRPIHLTEKMQKTFASPSKNAVEKNKKRKPISKLSALHANTVKLQSHTTSGILAPTKFAKLVTTLSRNKWIIILLFLNFSSRWLTVPSSNTRSADKNKTKKFNIPRPSISIKTTGNT